MLHKSGISIYASSFKQQKELLEHHPLDGVPVFLSLHISEEISPTYVQTIQNICDWLYDKNAYTIADIANDSLKVFHVDSFIALKRLLHISAFRLDCGFSNTQIKELAQTMPIVLNASTIDLDFAKDLVDRGYDISAMHNFYPRKDTGLDNEYLLETTQQLHSLGIKVYAFIPGDSLLRGPIYEGLPTLEQHRGIPPFVAYMELLHKYNIDVIFTGDPTLKESSINLISFYETTGIVPIPCSLNKDYEYLYNKVFTNRVDSPKWLIRFEESRAMASNSSQTIDPQNNTLPRCKGSITIDNSLYLRYAGEIQIMKSDLDIEPRTNIIGNVDKSYLSLLDCINRKQKFKLVNLAIE